jgi:hypothetical protein
MLIPAIGGSNEVTGFLFLLNFLPLVLVYQGVFDAEPGWRLCAEGASDPVRNYPCRPLRLHPFPSPEEVR